MVQALGAADCNPVTSPPDIRLVTSAPLRRLGGDPGPHQADPLPATSAAPSPARDHSPPELSRGVGPLQALGHGGHEDGRARGPAGRRSCTRRAGRSLDGGGTGCGGHPGPHVGSSGSWYQGPVAGWAPAGEGRQVGTRPDRWRSSGAPGGSRKGDGTRARREKGLGLDSTAAPAAGGPGEGQPSRPLCLTLPTLGCTRALGRRVGGGLAAPELCFPVAPHLGAHAFLELPLGGGLRAGPPPVPEGPQPPPVSLP